MRNSEHREAGLRLDELVRELPMRVDFVGDAAVRVHGVRHDSRAVQPGELFVARKGDKFDGAHFVADAVARGATAVLAARDAVDPSSTRVPIAFVEDPAIALAYAASALYGHPSFSLDVIGITGTNGKTTTTHLVRAAVDGALGQASCGILGTVGAFFGDWHQDVGHTTPEPDETARAMSEMQSRGATHVAMEVSSHALAKGRVRAMRFRVAALTNVTQDHLEFHGTMRDYAEAKARLFTELGPAAAVLNVDDAFGRELLQRIGGTVVSVSSQTGSHADIAPAATKVDARGIDAVIRTPRGDIPVASRLIGAHNLENLLLALGIAHALELDLRSAAAGLSRELGPPGRLERCDARGDDVTCLVDYAHTPDALARVLDALRTIAGARIWCVFGCGGDRDPTKREPMGQAAGERSDVVVVTNDNPRSEDPQSIADAVATGVRRAGRDPVIELDRKKAIDFAVRSASEGDMVLIAGKGHEDYQIVGTLKQPFDDRVETRRALAIRRRARESIPTRTRT